VAIRRARIYDAIAACVVIAIILLDQWTKSLVVAHLGPPEQGPTVSLIGPYLVLKYIQNSGAAFSVFKGSAVLVVLIVVAIGVVGSLYVRMLNSGPLIYKVILGMIIGGALGNLVDRAHNSGVVTDFISFNIPQMNFYFAIFNIADAAISVGVFLLFVLVLFGGLRRDKQDNASTTATQAPSPTNSGTLRTTEQDARP